MPKNVRIIPDTENKYRTIFENTGTATILIDADFSIAAINSKFMELMGYSRAEIEGKRKWTEFVHPDDLASMRAFHVLRRKEPESAPKSYEFRLLTKSGEVRHIFLTIDLIPDSSQSVASLLDITDRIRAEEALRKLEKELINTSERERQKIGRELHDDLCPHLIGIEVLVKVLQQKVKNRAEDVPAYADTISHLIREAINKTRDLSRGLCLVHLADHGLEASLNDLAHHIHHVFNIPCTFSSRDFIELKDRDTATHMYYIAHEAVHNAVKHAAATRIVIRLDADASGVHLQITDNGKGLPENVGLQNGMGLHIMRYRAQIIHADLSIRSPKNHGTTITLTLEHPNHTKAPLHDR